MFQLYGESLKLKDVGSCARRVYVCSYRLLSIQPSDFFPDILVIIELKRKPLEKQVRRNNYVLLRRSDKTLGRNWNTQL